MVFQDRFICVSPLERSRGKRRSIVVCSYEGCGLAGLATYARTVLELFGPEQARQSVEDWMKESELMDFLAGVAIRDWRRLTIAAASRLAVQSRFSFCREGRRFATPGKVFRNCEPIRKIHRRLAGRMCALSVHGFAWAWDGHREMPFHMEICHD